MPLNFPDELRHNNVNAGLADTDFIKGGTRTAVSSLTELYQLSAKSPLAPTYIGQLKDFATRVWVRSEGKYYTLVNEASARRSEGWVTDNILLSGVINPGVFDTTVKYVSASDGALSINYLTKATNSNGIDDSIISDNGSLVYVGGNLTVSGNLTALGNSYFANTIFTTTSSISVVNYGTGPAIYAFQSSGNQDIASFYDGDGVEVLHVGNCPPGELYGKVGINESNPNKELTVRGSVSASGTLNIGTLAIGTSDSILVESSGLIQKRTIDSRAWGSSLVDGTGTTNYVAKWSDADTIADSIVFDNGTNVGIGTNTPGAKLTVNGTLSTSGTATIGTIATNSAGTSFIVETAGLLQKRSLNVGSLDTTAVFVSASDGALTVNRLTKAENSNGIDESIVYDDGTNVGIGTDTPGAKLTVSGTLSTSGTATIGTLATGTVNSVLIESSGLIQKRDIDSRAWGSSLVDGTGTTNYVTKWSDADTVTNSIVFDDGNNVGIGTDTPAAKLTIAGNLSSSGTATIGTIATGTGTSILIESNGLIQKRTFSDLVGGASGVTGTGTANKITKWSDSDTVTDSIVTDNGSLVSVGGNLSTTGTATIGTLATGTVNSVLIESSGLIQKRDIDSRAWGSSLVDGTGTANRVAYWTDSNTIAADADLFFDGTNVGIGTTTPSEKLTIAGNISASGTATIGTLATNVASTSFVVETAGLLQKRSLNTAALNTTAVFVSASDGALTVNRLTKAENSNGINESIVFDDGTNVGIGTDTPSAKLDVNGSAVIQTNLTVKGNFTVLGTTSQLDTLVYTTSAVSITNSGTGPALTVTQTGSEPIAHFIDSNGDDIIFADNGFVGLGVTSPSEKLTIAGNLSASGTATIGTIATGATNSVVIQSAGLLQKRDINPQIWDTTARFVSASDGALTVNRLAKATNSNGINESIVYDDGTNVGIGADTPGAKLTVNGTLSTSSTVNVGGIGIGIDDSVVILDANGFLRTDEIDSRVWGSSLVDGTGTANYITKWSDADTIADSIVFDNGTNVGIGTNTPGAKLTVNGTLSTSGTATIGTIATGTANSVLIESSGLIQKRNIDARVWGTSLVDGTGTANYIPRWADTDTLANSIIYHDATNTRIGINNSTPTHTLDVGGNIKSANLLIPGSSTVTPTATTGLPSCNDVILNNQTGPVTITAFSGGVAGVTYTITNKSSHTVTLDTSASLFVRGGNSWASHKCTTNLEGYIVLPQNFSCSLRMDSATTGSAW